MAEPTGERWEEILGAWTWIKSYPATLATSSMKSISRVRSKREEGGYPEDPYIGAFLKGTT